MYLYYSGTPSFCFITPPFNYILVTTSTMTSKPIILVTGGNTGIGYETVKALLQSESAFTILMGSRSLDKAADAIKQIESEVPDSKSEVVALQIDIEDDESIEKAYTEVESKWGKVDALVNNAGKLSLFPLPNPLLQNLFLHCISKTRFRY
jgi:NAD(P)-dependent dehydrogenase (short-subunit alcohol dehydrogenase family)